MTDGSMMRYSIKDDGVAMCTCSPVQDHDKQEMLFPKCL
jgi:hypothetical protein